jgi:hypothetical protein
MSNRQKAFGDQQATLYSNAAITTALTGVAGTPLIGLVGMKALTAQAVFTTTSGGTSADVWVQTSLDLGATWIDIMNFHFTTTSASKVSAVVNTTALAAAVTPGSGALASNTILSGLLGDRVRTLTTTVGTYVGTSLEVDVVAHG